MSKIKQCTLLYVEDHQDTLDIYLKRLEGVFKKVYPARTGEEGLELFKRYHPDFILTDIKMPGLSGIEMAKAIRKIDPHKKIVFLTAYTPTNYLLEAIDLQPIKYLLKPIEPKALIDYFEEEANNGVDQMIPLGNGTFYLPEHKEVRKDNGRNKLTKMESSLLELFLQQDNRVTTYKQIDQLWGDKFMSINSLRTLIKNLRQKTHTDLIENLPNIGYRLNRDNQ